MLAVPGMTLSLIWAPQPKQTFLLTDHIIGLFIGSVCGENYVYTSICQSLIGLQWFGMLFLINISKE
jgi:hypothetical protein